MFRFRKYDYDRELEKKFVRKYGFFAPQFIGVEVSDSEPSDNEKETTEQIKEVVPRTEEPTIEQKIEPTTEQKQEPQTEKAIEHSQEKKERRKRANLSDLTEEEKNERRKKMNREKAKKNYNDNEKEKKKKYYQEHLEERRKKGRDRYNNLTPEQKHKRIEYSRRRIYIKNHGTEEGFVEKPFISQ